MFCFLCVMSAVSNKLYYTKDEPETSTALQRKPQKRISSFFVRALRKSVLPPAEDDKMFSAFISKVQNEQGILSFCSPEVSLRIIPFRRPFRLLIWNFRHPLANQRCLWWPPPVRQQPCRLDFPLPPLSAPGSPRMHLLKSKAENPIYPLYSPWPRSYNQGKPMMTYSCKQQPLARKERSFMHQSISKTAPSPQHTLGIWLEFCSIQQGIWPKMRPAQSGIWCSCQNVGQRRKQRIS